MCCVRPDPTRPHPVPIRQRRLPRRPLRLQTSRGHGSYHITPAALQRCTYRQRENDVAAIEPLRCSDRLVVSACRHPARSGQAAQAHWQPLLAAFVAHWQSAVTLSADSVPASPLNCPRCTIGSRRPGRAPRRPFRSRASALRPVSASASMNRQSAALALRSTGGHVR